MGKTIPKPSMLDDMESLGFIEGSKRWRNSDGSRLFTWDSLHGEVEVFNKRGHHLGAMDAVTGELIKDPVSGRTIKV